MNMIEKRKAMRGQSGFTLIELLVVIAILAVLGGAAIIGIGALRSNAELQTCKTDKETIDLAAEAFKTVPANNNQYPADIAALTGATPEPYLKDTPEGTWTGVDAGDAQPSAYGDLTNTELTECGA
jgi:prepilin-type N-terminal cleavage/methylation domain-containing protein